MGTYVITGSATGIGGAIRERLAQAGHRVIGVDLKDADVIADLSTDAGREAAVAGVRSLAAGGLDGMITCAGLASHVADHALIASVNYFGSTVLVESLADLLATNSASVVMIASNSAPMSTDDEYVDLQLDGNETAARARANEISGHESYSGSKLAVSRWLRRNTREFAGKGIRINAVAPGYTETPMTKSVAEDPTYGDSIRQFVASIPMGRAGQPEDISNLVEFLLSDKASFICGSVLFIDGGHDAMLRSDNF